MKSTFLKEYGQTIGPLGFPMADKSARALDLLLRTLPRTKEHEYRKSVVVKATTELNPGERSDVSWITTESVDRSGEVVVAKGMNDGQFAGNPLVTLGHAYHLPPVGRSLWRKRVKDGDLVGIKAKTRYPARPESWPDSSAWMPDQVFTLVQNGLLSGKSIGFLPTRAHFADSKESKKSGWPEGTLVFDEWLLLEYACCYLPVNQDALVETVSKGLLTLQPELLEALGLNERLLQTNPEQQPAPSQALRSTAFTALSEVERAVESAVRGIDLRKLTEEQVRLACDKARGRV